MNDEITALLRRAEDLSERAQRTGNVTHTGFLTPAESYALAQQRELSPLFHGGGAENERVIAFFLPDWDDPAEFQPAEYIRAVEIVARFAMPGHRDYLGAVLGLGIDRAWIGDILMDGERAWLYCLPSVVKHLVLNLEKVGRAGVKAREIPLIDVPAFQRMEQERTFTVTSLRLDAVCAGLFSMSRAKAGEAIANGLVSLNYTASLKPDAPIHPGDILSLRGKGKGRMLDCGGEKSKKGRFIVRAALFR